MPSSADEIKSDAPKIIPHKNENNSWDILRAGSNYYIIRSDLDSGNSIGFKIKSDLSSIETFIPSDAMSGGSSYFGRYDSSDKKSYKYCIKGATVQRVSNMTSGKVDEKPLFSGNTDLALHYFQTKGKYFIVRDDSARSIYSGPSLQEQLKYAGTMNSSIPDALAICANDGKFYVLSDDLEAGLVIDRYSDLIKGSGHAQYIIPDSVKRILPGGITLTKGITVAEWIPFWSEGNGSESPIEREVSEILTDGYNREEMEEIETNWEASAELSVGSELAQSEMTLSVTNGGATINTSSAGWSAGEERSYKADVTIEAGKNVTIYQLAASFDDFNKPLLSTWNFHTTDDGKYPIETAQDAFHRLYPIA